ncbi:ribonuclease H family protein [Streptomyces sp. SP18CS02]|uniref:ribonuclease H family protein n=1 Tax=Streptomyces sp. SP18CS02 TaxID=3002531 RepID=UPI002E76F99F|nr:ribonuclease H [Streptomyces sp. SP18CS02]MEE1751540.1 ribonuclease HI [Streptomyces sp. SP18CS02]
MSERIIAACDGAAKGNPGPAGWAWVIADAQGKPQRWESGALGRSTNNVGELTALLKLLETLPPGAGLEVRMDSQYAMKAVTQWLPGWKRNGWKTAGGKPVANRELIQQIDLLLADRDVDFVHVPAHRTDGDPLNAIADQAASEAAVSQQPAGTALGQHELPVPDPARSSPARAASGPARRRPSATGSGASTRSGGSGPTIKAKFAGRCSCGSPYAAGATITKLDKGWGHPECRTGDTAEAGARTS